MQGMPAEVQRLLLPRPSGIAAYFLPRFPALFWTLYCTAARSKPPPPLAAPQLDSRASSGRAWRLCAARHSQEEAGPLGAQPPPRLLEPAASKAVDSTAFDHSGPEIMDKYVGSSEAQLRQLFTNPPQVTLTLT